MSARLTAILDFVGSRFQAGIARANAAVSGLGSTFGKMKTAFAGFGGLGGLLGIGGISKLWQDATKMAEEALARMDFSKISKKNAAAIVSAKRDFESLFQTITAGAAVAFSKVTDSFRKVGAFFGSLSAGDTIKEAIDAANAESKAAEEAAIAEAQREAAFARMTKTVASGLDIMAKRRREHAEAAKKEAEEVLKSEEVQQQGHVNTFSGEDYLSAYEFFRNDALSGGKQSKAMRDAARSERKNDTKFQRILNSANAKLADPLFQKGIGGRRLSAAEQSALKAQVANQGVTEDAMTRTADNTKRLVELIGNMGLGG